MNINEISINDYEQMTDENKINFYTKIKSDNTFVKAVRQKRTKNMKEKGFKQSNGHLTFIDELKRTDKKVTNFYYLCVCDCGNWYILTNRHFDQEDMVSCGCYRKARGAEMCKNIIGPNNALDLKGKIFGDLEVVEKTNKRIGDYNVIWKCKCINCGAEQEVQATMLNRQIRLFCENCSQRKSKGEKIISFLLDINNIVYEKEKIFETCKFPNSNYYGRFDFYVNNTYLIEFDGQQHFMPEKFSNNISEEKAKELFLKTQERDNFKNNWCKENNIPLIRIPYFHLDKICLNDLLLETSQFII